MDALQSLLAFFQAIAHDNRIRPMHIAVFTTLLQYRIGKGCINPITVYSRDVMAIAKISKATTYCRCLSELGEYGYIGYKPSFKKNQPSSIYFKEVTT